MSEPTSAESAPEPPSFVSRLLNAVERAGNRLPDPMTLFIAGTIIVMVMSEIAVSAGWSVEKTTRERDKDTQELVTTTTTVEAVSLLRGDGAYFSINSLVDNFTGFAPLGIVLVGMLGIGVAEKTGLIGALLKVFMAATPQKLLTPAMVFIGIMSSMALDAGYVVLPPVAAALYKSVGRSPLVGLAAVFAGVAAGFSANLFITGIEPLIAGITQEGAQVFDKDFEVAATCNWTFIAVSTVLLTFVGWGVSAWLVEPRYHGKAPEDGGPAPVSDQELRAQRLTESEKRALRGAGVAFALVVAAIVIMILTPGGPLHGQGARFARWIHAIVPILFFVFLLPAVTFGVMNKTITNDKHVAGLMSQTMSDMGAYIVLAFFAAQFVAFFNHSHLGEMTAIAGGNTLQSADMPVWLLLTVFILIIVLANIFIGSMSAKWAFLAPVFVPMFMTGANIHPALTQAAYRIGDSVSNCISPLNPYVIIILVFMQKYVPKAGIGTLVALMLPYSLVFLAVWTLLLIVWILTGAPLGPEGPLMLP